MSTGSKEDLVPEGLRNLRAAIASNPIVNPFAILLIKLIDINKQAKCNKTAFQVLNFRLESFAGLVADVISCADDDHPEEGGNHDKAIQDSMKALEEAVKVSIDEIESYSYAGWTMKFWGAEPKQVFNKLDADLTLTVNKLCDVLGLPEKKTETTTHDVNCNLKEIVDELGGLRAVLDSDVQLEQVENKSHLHI